ncbi:MAG: HAD-IA family hydrolase [Burkholderiales bacterium]|nr:HAD-IA family hydrolase [Burkholderiales bacterium]
MPYRVSAITLDLDDTLWAIDPVIERAERMLHQWCEQRAPKLALALPPAEFAAYRRALAQELPTLAHDYTALRLEALRRALRLHGEDHALAEPALEHFLAARNQIELYPDAQEALARLAARFPLAVVSNGNADVERIGIHGFFAAIVNARGVGFPKPDERIFHAACARLDVSPAAVLHVGDDPDLDVRGAIGAGARAAWINRHGRAWSGEAVAGAHEFPDLLALCRWLGV